MTERLDLDDPDLRAAEARVLEVRPEGVVLDRTPFYPRAGGQPGDTGWLRAASGVFAVGEALKGEAGTVLHPLAGAGPSLSPGETLTAAIDGERRNAHRRMHTALHLLCALLPGAGVTGGQIGAERSRLDFDLPESPDRARLAEGLRALVEEDHPVGWEWVEESVLDREPGLVRTLSVQPPRGLGRLRLVRIGTRERTVDLQPCGGTHVRTTGAIGPLAIAKIENKGRQNRRVVLVAAAAWS